VSRRGTVLAYHGVGEPPAGEDRHNLFVTPQRFAEQMAFLARRRRVVPLTDLLAGGAGPRAVAITFDDAYRHVLETALPVLERHGFPSTVFVPTRFVGGRNEWDEPSACDLDVMSADELLEAERRGMRVESHGHAHIDCRTAPIDDVRADLAASQDRLEELVGRRPRLLAWPFRDGSPQARAEAERLGFDVAFSIDLPHAGPFSHERVQVTPRDSLRLFALKTSGRYPALRHSPALDRGYRLVRRVVRP
jgi:peptidoglycan/xylan/chitin deacetylase (PgdA/CDA1 family)